ncbi:MAG: Gfo/Idh/MocA family oxidoreductase [Clostridia bacterium]|nr:Gfo/Idh/MocA family oxidoreductase [Clostridia bacterium]
MRFHICFGGVFLKPLSLIIIGAGGRGRTYAAFAQNRPDLYRVVGVAEPIDIRRNYILQRHPDAKDAAYRDWTEILDRPKFADIAVITTMDRMHLAPALRAIELGYDLLLEKPIAPTASECKLLCEAAEAKGTRVLVCHVLRYTGFFRAVKSCIDSGKLGRIMSITHTEGVGNIHQSHSFVRGNWHNSEESSFMLLQKSCHDLDILQWLLGCDCRRVQSFGSLSYFTPENRPEGAPDYCLDGCPHADTCRYHVEKIYFNNPHHPWMRHAVADDPSPDDDTLREELRHGRFGRCVFACDNDVVDHQIVNLEFDGGITVNFTMNAFNLGGRRIRIMGTEGELEAAMGAKTATITNYDTETSETVPLSSIAQDETITGGHGGGDAGIMHAMYDYIAEGKLCNSICDIRTAYRNHLIAFAAEESRLTGTVVDLAEYEKTLR